MRGNDIPFNPFFYSYTLLTLDEIWWDLLLFLFCIRSTVAPVTEKNAPTHPNSARLFIHTERLTGELKEYLNASCAGPLCVQLKSYDSVRAQLQEYVARPGIKVWIGTEYTNYALYELITPVVRLSFIHEFVSVSQAWMVLEF